MGLLHVGVCLVLTSSTQQFVSKTQLDLKCEMCLTNWKLSQWTKPTNVFEKLVAWGSRGGSKTVRRVHKQWGSVRGWLQSSGTLLQTTLELFFYAFQTWEVCMKTVFVVEASFAGKHATALLLGLVRLLNGNLKQKTTKVPWKWEFEQMGISASISHNKALNGIPFYREHTVVHSPRDN